MEKMSEANNPIFNRSEYKQAKKFLSNAEKIEGGYISPSYSRKMYKKGGRIFMECESHLENPFDDYAVYEVIQEEYYGKIIRTNGKSFHSCNAPRIF